MKDNGEVEFLDLFDPRQPRSDKDLIEYRLDICNQCPAFRKASMRCSKCGCYMKLKTTLQEASCPIGRW
jgi:hypothetical protein